MSIASRLADVEEAQRLLRNANRLQDRRVSATAPSDNALLGWNATTKKWEPKSDAPAARVYNSGSIAITTGTSTALTFNSERYDTDTIHSTSSNTGRLTATTAGKYIIFANVRWQAGINERILSIREGGDTTIARVDQPVTDTADFTHQSVATIYNLAAGEYVECLVQHNHGSNRNIVAASNVSPEFGMTRIGPTGTGGGASAHGDLTGVTSDQHHTAYTDPDAVAAIEAEPTLEFDAATVVSTASGGLDLDAAATLKLQPSATGSVILFGDTDVGDGTAGRSLLVYRKAAEGDDFILLFVDAAQRAQLTATLDLEINADTLYLDLGDNAGSDKVIIRDSDNAEVAAIDSNGNITLSGTLDGVDIAARDHTKYADSDAITAVPFIQYIPFGSEPITGQSYAP